MKTMMIALAGSFLAATLAVSPAMAQDKAKPAEKDQRERKVLVDNDKVLVTENIYKPGASSGMQARGNRVVRALSDGQLEKTTADGKKETVTWKSGEVRYSPKETYSQKNTGKTDLHLYTVTIK
jgi:hypothetical protein